MVMLLVHTDEDFARLEEFCRRRFFGSLFLIINGDGVTARDGKEPGVSVSGYPVKRRACCAEVCGPRRRPTPAMMISSVSMGVPSRPHPQVSSIALVHPMI
jgi:hypothetical protein